MKTAVVTGGASGIGARCVERLIAGGWTVWSLGRTGKALAGQAEALKAGERLHWTTCDVGDSSSVASAFEKILYLRR